VLSCKTKEFIVLGAAVAQHCAPCVLLHVQKLAELGATREEILEAASIGVVMGGGPGFTNMQYVFQGLEDAGL
jgi:AhpD family alkylhydroperoxidase